VDIKNIRHQIETEFHVLRHFASVSSELRERLAEAGYSSEQISSVLSLPGSRFHPAFANSIQDLLSHLKDAKIEEHTGLNGNQILTATFDAFGYKEGIGTVAIVPLTDLDKDQQKKVYKAENRGFLLNHLDVEKLPYTWQLTIILSKADETWSLITAFPGPSALPIPNAQMSSEMYNQCLTYWEGQVFLV
jgi:hypothetical protein